MPPTGAGCANTDLGGRFASSTDMAGVRGVEAMLEDRRPLPTAILAANDLVAAGALRSAPARHVLEPNLVVRDSTAPAPAEPAAVGAEEAQTRPRSQG